MLSRLSEMIDRDDRLMLLGSLKFFSTYL